MTDKTLEETIADKLNILDADIDNATDVIETIEAERDALFGKLGAAIARREELRRERDFNHEVLLAARDLRFERETSAAREVADAGTFDAPTD